MFIGIVFLALAVIVVGSLAYSDWFEANYVPRTTWSPYTGYTTRYVRRVR